MFLHIFSIFPKFDKKNDIFGLGKHLLLPSKTAGIWYHIPENSDFCFQTISSLQLFRCADPLYSLNIDLYSEYLFKGIGGGDRSRESENLDFFYFNIGYRPSMQNWPIRLLFPNGSHFMTLNVHNIISKYIGNSPKIVIFPFFHVLTAKNEAKK